jgi:uncharacterized protein
MRRFLVLLWVLAGLFLAAQAPPRRWVTDGPGLLSPAVRDRLDRRLEAYEHGTGHQVLVWIGDSTGGEPIEDWTVRAFKAWQVGRKGLDDGLALFVFSRDRTLRIEVGYGLEGRMPDLVASRIIRETIVPRLKAGDPDGALSAGVDRILKVLGGDAGAAAPQAPARGQPLGPLAWIVIALLGLGLLGLAVTHPGLAVWMLFSLLSGGRGGGGGGGGFSGGGGRSGGGGASGDW